MRRTIFLLLIIVILFFNCDVYAICDTADINRLKEIAKNVDVNYEHNVYGDLDSDDPEAMIVSVFDFSVSGLTDELYIMDDNHNVYYSTDAVDGIISFVSFSGERKVYIYSSNCDAELLDTRSFNLPVFNFNSMNEECKKDEFKDLAICSEFINEDDMIQGDEFEKEIKKVEENSTFDNILNFMKDNALIILLVLIALIVVVVVFSFRHYKRSVLE